MSHDKDQKDNKQNATDNLADDLHLEDEQAEVVDVDVDGEGDEAEPLKDDLNKALEELEKTRADLEKEKKEYLFLMAEFDNFRKRVVREKADLIKNGAEKAMKGILPVVDDFERGLQAMANTDDPAAIKEGMELIYNKFVKYLADNGVQAIESTGAEFDTEKHEAIATVPAQSDDQKNHVLDTTTKGYTLNDKVLRHAKVVVAQ